MVGRPILYKTSKEFLIHFGLKSLDELPSLEEFEELARVSLAQEGTLPLAFDVSVPAAEESSAQDAHLQDEPSESDLETPVIETKASGVELSTSESESPELKSLTTETT